MVFQFPKTFTVIHTTQLRRFLNKQTTKKKNPLYFPYGESSFEDIRKQGCFFVDKTHYLELIEGKGRRLSLFRPPRWGKSLFAGTMEAYYCALNNKEKNPAKFEMLFGDTYICKNTTEEQGKYVVLFWDFSISTTGDTLLMEKGLYKSINEAIDGCQVKYKDLLKENVEIDHEDAMITFKKFARLVKSSGYPLYLIIDEYDRFANKLLFETPDAYKNMISGKSGDPKSSVIRNVLETVKSVGREGGMRTFITGISPMAMADASGYNICKNITHDSDLAELLGALKKVFPDDPGSVKEHLDIMKEWYNGYRMHEDGPLLYNPTLSLYYLDKIWSGKSNTEFNMLDQNTKISETISELLLCIMGKNNLFIYKKRSDYLIYQNTKISESIFELISKNPNSNILIAALYNGEEQSVHIQERFRLLDLLTGIHDISRDDLLSFMYHQGVVTFSEEGKLVIPNKLAKNQFFDRVRSLLKPGTYSLIVQFFEMPSAELLTDIVKTVTVDILKPSGDSGTFNEVALKTILAASFNNATSNTIKSEYDFGSKYGGKRADLLIFDKEDENPNFMLELGVIKLGQIVPKSLIQFVDDEEKKSWILRNDGTNKLQNAHFWSIKKKDAFESSLQKLSITELNTLEFMPDFKKPDNVYTVADFITEKKKQLYYYRQFIRKQCSTEPKSYVVVNIGMQTTICEEI
ncbi:hypothetical protein MP638_006660 [Amoeboaphelidium occidentale]|nr:hypothetical protein MP638_006660 [Amoeboaphelidium occidentale]